jgi:antitoxin (DNA-binding transcriptional repressor) of toxin-antitoxin stability system
VKAGHSIEVTEHGRVIAVITPVAGDETLDRPRPRVGGYRSGRSMTAEEIDAALAEGFGNSDRR